ncbi:tethering complex ATP-binding subunit VPS33 NDAI_0J02310 [Naumovozyma dairenensis CBS 421]|uniref:Uncharacterized protein n=1 Tax=Naumovozyma dairenensis (strain ATCC 10597 / BCRC 20456 / CBS 421 / NBRC 0211 / NRRL Y-12639) TaxID=1071378 RepID=G0WH45_NAUDC|nr:hypothetical protein NDAI_0J02310 [Naumovozyma dairenensis CBS 421]CCD27123.1 hypothetical protein NDAI_0J02310 [Naumovozyma dairenensis CBS 421]
MNLVWNTRKFAKISRNNLCKTLNDIGGNDQILVVQPNVRPYLNRLMTFSQLTEMTNVSKIAILDDLCFDALQNIQSSMSEISIIFLIDVRVDLVIPTQLKKIVRNLSLSQLHIIHCDWKSQRTSGPMIDDKYAEQMITDQLNQDEAGSVINYVESQLHQCLKEISNKPKLNLFSWGVLPFPTIDDNVLINGILYNSDNDNMYFPRSYSMESATRSILLDNMVSCLHSLLQETSTIITNYVAIGNESKKYVELLHDRIISTRTNEDIFIEETLFGGKFQNEDLETDLIVIERDTDPITVLLTQLTYGGILDDLYTLTPYGSLQDKEDDILFDHGEDDIWEDLKFLNFGAAGPELSKIAKSLQTKYDARHNADTVGEIKQFVDSLGSLQARQKLLNLHTTLSSDVLEEVEENESLQFNRILEMEQDFLLNNLDNKACCESILDLIYEGDVSSTKIIRLVCLFSLLKVSCRDKDFETFKKELIDTFGIEICFTLERLTKAGYFISKSLDDSKNPTMESNSKIRKEFRYLSSWLDMLPTEEDIQPSSSTHIPGGFKPEEPTFAYCGVVPLTTRLIQLLYDRSILSKNYLSQQPFIISKEPNVSQTEELFEQLYGDSKIIRSGTWIAKAKGSSVTKPTNSKKEMKKYPDVVIVVFLGGVTVGEIATLNHLQSQLEAKGVKKRFIILCDDLINGNKLINSLQP